MSHMNHPLWGLALAGAALTAGAQTPTTDHSQHHPATPPAAPVSPQAAAPSAAPSTAAMDNQMKAMREMHEKMTGAKTPEERQALMAEHMKTMHEGMAMMNRMGGPGMGSMGGMQGGKPMMGDMHERHQMMEKRMDMMQSMMQMMMDRLPPPAAR